MTELRAIEAGAVPLWQPMFFGALASGMAWGIRGQYGHETFNWKSLSITGGLALWRFYFQMHAGSIKSPQVVEFLQIGRASCRERVLASV